MGVTDDELAFAYRLALGRLPTPQEAQRDAGAEIAVLRRRLLGPAEMRAARRLPDARPTLVHLHVPKTAGTSLNALLNGSYPADQVQAVPSMEALRKIDPEARRRLTVIHGHMLHGVDRLLPQGAVYLTLLRQPAPRIHSFYRFILRSRKHPLHRLLRGREMSFGDFLDFAVGQPRVRVEVDNGQMRRISGIVGQGSFARNPAVLRAALANLFAPDMIFGLTERFDEFLARIRAAGLIARDGDARLNVSPETADMDEVIAALTPSQRQVMSSFVAWDQCLYDICSAYLTKQGSST